MHSGLSIVRCMHFVFISIARPYYIIVKQANYTKLSQNGHIQKHAQKHARIHHRDSESVTLCVVSFGCVAGRGGVELLLVIVSVVLAANFAVPVPARFIQLRDGRWTRS